VAYEGFRHPEARVEVHLILYNGRRGVGTLLESPGALLILEVPTHAVEIDAVWPLIVSSKNVMNGR
jgi:hypothetical protein